MANKDFLQLIDDMRAEEASPERLWAGEGTPARRRNPSPEHRRKVAEVASFVADVIQGKVSFNRFREAMTTSDFPLLFGEVLDRTVLAGYRSYDPVWPMLARRKEVRDFRPAKMYTLDGSEGELDEVPERTEYPEGSLVEAEFSLSVKKYGRKLDFTWEMGINDDLDMLRDAPFRLGKGARRTEDRHATRLFVDVNGPHASLYTNGNGNIINAANGASSNNPVLSLAALQQGLIVLSRQVDSEGHPVQIATTRLVVPPSLEITARNILNATAVEMVETGGTTNQKLIAENWMKNAMQLVVDPYIRIEASSANGSTSWFLFGDPDEGRPALVMGFLRAHSEPEIRMKKSDSVRVGGGDIPAEEGDFDTDSVKYRVRHVLGEARVEPKVTVASNGSGS